MRLRDLGFLLGGGLVALALVSTVTAAPVVVPVPAAAPVVAPAPGASPAPAPAPVAASTGEGGIAVTAVNESTFVTVKDHGDSQTVMVFTLDANGQLKPVPQKSRFYFR